ncbi:MAG: hypothetical protein JW759_04185 [Candidatus Coatesbacteria bacterium]|nr:hypothetical protein [Candidatus Coatesbacteria bacterium]
MSRKSLLALCVCLMIGAGVAAYVWATGCCDGLAKLCNGSAAKEGGTECDYEFNVDLDRGCVTGATVRVYYQKDSGGMIYNQMLAIFSQPPYDWCVDYRVGGVTLDSDDWRFWFTVTGSCTDRLPPGSLYFLLETSCD